LFCVNKEKQFMATSAKQQAVILFAHGSRDPLWRRPIEAVAHRMKQLSPQTEVACAYLELSEPNLPSTVSQLVSHGIGNIRIVPMFLGVGKHAREDLPQLVQDLKGLYPHVSFELRQAVGEEPELIQSMAAIALRVN
jgi:sirohydrochlorin cobaltochelatase